MYVCSRSMTYGNVFRHPISNEVCPPSLHLVDHILPQLLSTPYFHLDFGLPLFLLTVGIQFKIFWGNLSLSILWRCPYQTKTNRIHVSLSLETIRCKTNPVQALKTYFFKIPSIATSVSHVASSFKVSQLKLCKHVICLIRDICSVPLILLDFTKCQILKETSRLWGGQGPFKDCRATEQGQKGGTAFGKEYTLWNSSLSTLLNPIRTPMKGHHVSPTYFCLAFYRKTNFKTNNIDWINAP
jgi:hypothetical protein